MITVHLAETKPSTMLSAKIRQSLPVVFFLFLLSCNNGKKEKKGGDMSPTPVDTITSNTNTTSSAAESPSPVPHAEPSGTEYAYEPVVSTLTGTITTEMFYGAPGYGENPATDTKEYPFLIIPDQPINVVATPQQVKEETEETKMGVSKLQLIWPDNINMEQYKGKRVKITGTLFGPQTGHHHTDVLMDVQTLTAL